MLTICFDRLQYSLAFVQYPPGFFSHFVELYSQLYAITHAWYFPQIRAELDQMTSAYAILDSGTDMDEVVELYRRCKETYTEDTTGKRVHIINLA